MARGGATERVRYIPSQLHRMRLTELGRSDGDVAGKREGACRGRRRSDREGAGLPRQHHRTMLMKLGRRCGDVIEGREGACRRKRRYVVSTTEQC